MAIADKKARSLPRSLEATPGQMNLMVCRAMRWWEKGVQPNMREIESAQDLTNSLLNAGDKLIIVDFFSPGCGGCRAFHPKMGIASVVHLHVFPGKPYEQLLANQPPGNISVPGDYDIMYLLTLWTLMKSRKATGLPNWGFHSWNHTRETQQTAKKFFGNLLSAMENM